jgi:hypothetical protein
MVSQKLARVVTESVLGILLMWAVRRWSNEAFQAAQTGARAH